MLECHKHNKYKISTNYKSLSTVLFSVSVMMMLDNNSPKHGSIDTPSIYSNNIASRVKAFLLQQFF